MFNDEDDIFFLKYTQNYNCTCYFAAVFSHPLSSMVFGTNALLTKPATSLAPMITVYFLNQYGYEAYKAGKSTDLTLLKSTVFLTACWTPIVIGLLQHFLWKQYTIRNSHQTKYRGSSATIP